MAQALHPLFNYGKDGKLSRQGLENVRTFLLEYGLIAKEKAPPVEKMYTAQFIQ